MALPKGETGQTGTSFMLTGLERRLAAASGLPKEGRAGRPLERPVEREERFEEREEAREEREERSEERAEREDAAPEEAPER